MFFIRLPNCNSFIVGVWPQIDKPAPTLGFLAAVDIKISFLGCRIPSVSLVVRCVSVCCRYLRWSQLQSSPGWTWRLNRPDLVSKNCWCTERGRRYSPFMHLCPLLPTHNKPNGRRINDFWCTLVMIFQFFVQPVWFPLKQVFCVHRQIIQNILINIPRVDAVRNLRKKMFQRILYIKLMCKSWWFIFSTHPCNWPDYPCKSV